MEIVLNLENEMDAMPLAQENKIVSCPDMNVIPYHSQHLPATCRYLLPG